LERGTVPVNADKPHLWKADVAKSAEQFNSWFIDFAPATFQDERRKATDVVTDTLRRLGDLVALSPSSLAAHPDTITTLRMATAPPIARDRLVGLAQVSKGAVTSMEKGSPPRDVSGLSAKEALEAIFWVIDRLLDRGIFPWLSDGRAPTLHERELAAVIVGDRLCGAAADPAIRNAQEARQLAAIAAFLEARAYRRKPHPRGKPLKEMEPGTFAVRMVVVVGSGRTVDIPVDVVIQPHTPTPGGLPILIEAKSAGDFTNTNKRRKEEATKIRQLRDTYGKDIQLILFLCGYFDAGYLGYEAAEGLDWVWEHRIEDLLELGV
jgi:hypothetical protein